MNTKLLNFIEDVREAESSPYNRLSASEIEQKKVKIRELEKQKVN